MRATQSCLTIFFPISLHSEDSRRVTSFRLQASPLLWELQRGCCSSEMFSALPVSQEPAHQKPELYFPCEAPITSLLGFAPLGFCYYKIHTESPTIDSKASEDHGLLLRKGCYLPKDFKMGSILEVVYLGPRLYQRTHNV